MLYDGSILLEYKDKAHRYFARPRIDFTKQEDDPTAWGKTMYPKGTTTLLGDTLEKKGLMTWPLGLSLKELFGYYDFTGDDGTRKQGFSDGVGTMWQDGKTLSLDKETLLPLVDSANKAWTRKQKQGADIGSVVHEAIEHFIRGGEFDIAAAYTHLIEESEGLEAKSPSRVASIAQEIQMATNAYTQFTYWWRNNHIVPEKIEELIYSKKYNISGTFDGLLRIGDKLVLADFKTSNASKSKDAAMPEGISYQYFIQSAIYAMAWQEMTGQMVDDLLIVSCRKDGEFTTIYASELGITVEQAINWSKAVIVCYQMMDKTKQELNAHAEKGVI